MTTSASKFFLRNHALEVLEGGEYQLTFNDGESISINTPETKESINILGPWEVTFQEDPQLGESFSTKFQRLMSFTESNEHGIKYFSGTAHYKKVFTNEWNSPEGRAYLDLGKVGDIATVKLNDNEVVVLWKPPYRADITDFLVEGENMLEVAVTNLWINRIIGDEKLPPEQRKTNTNLRNIEGRYSFERFVQPDDDKYLRYSGLLGPVKIQFSNVTGFKK